MTPDEAQIREIVRSVWSTQLGLDLDLEPGHAASIPPPLMTAAVHISGDLSFGVRMVAGRDLVRRAAAVMFDRDPDRLEVADERDVLGELTNIIAGNLKSLLPGANSISLPTLVDGTDYTVSTTDVRSSHDFGFSLDGAPFVLTLIEHTVSSSFSTLDCQ